MTRAAVLTPPGTGAIATVRVTGPEAWELVRTKFRPAKGMLPDVPPLHRFWFGNLGDGPGDEVIVAVRQVEPEVCVEIHCHGGRRVVRWVVETLAPFAPERRGAGEGGISTNPFSPEKRGVDERALDPLTKAITVKAASVLLDQYHGAFTRAVGAILADLPNSQERLHRLAELAPVGRHLVEPWRVVIAGPPNVGKSSLVNALAGYQRSVIAPVAGTTRDVVTVRVALDGWPVELSDTAGLRDTAESLEAAGIDRAKRQLAAADAIVWVLDYSDPHPVWPTHNFDGRLLLAINKSDQPPAWNVSDLGDATGMLGVSATTGAGVPEFGAAIVARLVPHAPEPGEGVPFTPALAELVEQADAAVIAGNIGIAHPLLQSCLVVS
jgi:tRNA modification GTPase